MEKVIIQAVAGVLKLNNKVLMATRPSGKVKAGSWEFPGGKLEFGEGAIAALIRELKEEIGVEVKVANCKWLTMIKHDYPHGMVNLDVFVVNHWDGQVSALEKQELVWQDLNEPCIHNPLLPTTQKILDLLKNSFC